MIFHSIGKFDFKRIISLNPIDIFEVIKQLILISNLRKFFIKPIEEL